MLSKSQLHDRDTSNVEEGSTVHITWGTQRRKRVWGICKYVLGWVKGLLRNSVQYARMPWYFSITSATWKLHNESPEGFFWTVDVAMFSFPCGTLCSCLWLKKITQISHTASKLMFTGNAGVVGSFFWFSLFLGKNSWENSLGRLFLTYIVVLPCKWYLSVPLDFFKNWIYASPRNHSSQPPLVDIRAGAKCLQSGQCVPAYIQ